MKSNIQNKLFTKFENSSPSKSIFFQPKLTINEPNDVYEQEADAVAEQVMRMPVSKNENTFFKPVSINSIQRKCDECEEEKKLQMKSEGGDVAGMTAPNIVHDVVNSAGQPLDTRTRSFMESRFGYDFRTVQIHNDSLAHRSSADINALAYTHGNHVVFGAGQYQPNSNSGKQLLAHELAHVVQQRDNKSFINRDTVVDAGVPPAARPEKSAISGELETIWYNKGKSAFFQRLRNLTPDQYDDMDTLTFILDNLSGDESWLAEGLLSWGPETQWDFITRIELELKSLPLSRGFAGVSALLKSAGIGERIAVLRFMITVLKSRLTKPEFAKLLTDLDIIELIKTASDSEKQMILTNPGLMKLLKIELPMEQYNILNTELIKLSWPKLVGEGFDAKNTDNKDLMESKFIDALKLIGYTDVNIARGGGNDYTKLKAGLNLDILYTKHFGEAGYLYNNTFSGSLPLDIPDPDFAEIIGEFAFQRESSIHTRMGIEHEKTHTEHHKKSLELYKKWKEKADMIKFKKDLDKGITDLNKHDVYIECQDQRNKSLLMKYKLKLTL